MHRPRVIGRLAVYSLGAALTAFLVLNVMAYFHVWSMLHFAGQRERTPPPERLGWAEKVKVILVGVELPRPANWRTPAAVGLDFTTHRFSTADGMELEAWWIARPAPRGVVLLFHGYGATKSDQLDEAKAFHALGFSTFLVDHRGHGGSAGDWTSIGYHEATDVVAAVDYVRSHFRPASPPILYGQSMGAVAVVRAVAVAPVNPSAMILEGLYDRILSAIRNRFGSMGLPSFPSAELLAFWGGVQMGFPAFRHNPVDYARSITVPVLMLHGADDPRATRQQARRVFEILPGHKTFVEFPGLRHQSLYRASPEQWTTAVAGFLAVAAAVR
jgi:alpha-beta hydrolase superfamily lysophospholipase